MARISYRGIFSRGIMVNYFLSILASCDPDYDPIFSFLFLFLNVHSVTFLKPKGNFMNLLMPK